MSVHRLSDDELFEKHKGGVIPPLVSLPDSRFGLVNGHLLEIYQRGFSFLHSVPLGMLLANLDFEPGDPRRWTEGNYRLNNATIRDWTNLCQLIRRDDTQSGKCPGDTRCDQWDRRMAQVAESRDRAIAYLCPHGLIDMAVPVRVGPQTIAVLFSGQLRPEQGLDWPGDLLDAAGSDVETVTPVDVGAESQKRIQRLTVYGISDSKIKEAISADEARPRSRVGPTDVRSVLEQMDSAAQHLGTMAATTYELEQARLVSVIRFGLAQALVVPDVRRPNWDGALRSMEPQLRRLAVLYGMDYVALCRTGTTGPLAIVCQSGLDPFLESSDGHSSMLPSSAGDERSSDGVSQIDLSLHSRMPVVTRMVAHARQSGLDNPKMLCATPRDGFGFVLVMGSLKSQKVSISGRGPGLVMEIATIASLVGETLHLLKGLRHAEDDMGHLLEDVAHDLRSPIQTIVYKAARLKSETLSPDECKQQARKIAAACMRLNLLAHRLWASQRLTSGKLEYSDSAVRVKEVVQKAVDTLTDLSEHEGIDLVTDWEEIEQMRSVQLDGDLFLQCVLNVLHNAIKYSTSSVTGRRPQVTIRGRVEALQWVIAIANRGICIRDKDIPHIFGRYYRTAEAVRYRPEGTGIGLSIVKHFVDHYKGEVRVTSTPMDRTTDHRTVFEIVMPAETRR